MTSTDSLTTHSTDQHNVQPRALGLLHMAPNGGVVVVKNVLPQLVEMLL